MSRIAKILIIDNNKINRQLLSSIFTDYQVDMADTVDLALDRIGVSIPDLVIIGSDFSDFSEYDICKELKENQNTKNTAVFFLTDSMDLEGRLKAYGAGADDYLCRPFDHIELKTRIDKVLLIKHEREALSKELQISYDIALDMQRNASKIQAISRFLEANLCCHDISALSELFFKTTKELDVSCVIQIVLEKETLRISDNGIVHNLEAEILEKVMQLDRIHSFGSDRSVYNWKNVSVLVRNTGENIDIMAILMNGLEAGIHSIETESKLLELAHDLEEQNNFIQESITRLFAEMKLGLKNTFLSLGLVSSLDIDDEDRLNDQVDLYHEKISEQLAQLNKNNDKVKLLINELKTSAENDQDTDIDDIEGVSLF